MKLEYKNLDLNNDFIKFIQSINKKLIDINKEEHNTVDDFINEVITRLLFNWHCYIHNFLADIVIIPVNNLGKCLKFS